MAKKSKKFKRVFVWMYFTNYEDYTGKGVAEANEFLKYLFSMFPDEDSPNLLRNNLFYK